MTTDDFSIEFDLLFNNIASNKAPGLNEYEKTLFLTEAQENIVRSLYSGGLNSFETSEEMSSYLSSIVKCETFVAFENVNLYGWNAFGVDIPNKIWYITLEDGVADDKPVEVIPVTHDMFLRTVRNPFRGPSRKRALRVSRAGKATERYSIVIPAKNTNLTQYNVHYVEKPEPIILEEDITIDNITYSEKQTSKLPESIHRMILLEAVKLAKSIWG